MPFIEEKAIWSYGQGIDFTKNPTLKQSALVDQLNKPLPLLYCPSRRPVALYPYGRVRAPLNLNILDLQSGVLKTDYAINVGDTGPDQYPGPNTMQEVDNGTYKWPSSSVFTGVSFQRSQVTPPMITDGLSHTYLLGEKYLNPNNYIDGVDLGDNEAATQGFDNDMCRIAGLLNTPMPDTAGDVKTDSFGAAHLDGFNMVFCDGSVHMIDYLIDPAVHADLANRADGQSIDTNSIH